MTGTVINFTSPNGITEQAISLTKIPEGTYKSRDSKKEDKYLSVDFYNEEIGLCPKTWSTSPGTMVRDISQSGLSQRRYERSHCSGKTVANSVKKIAKFKQTMNQHNTSGTFSMSSLLYYHFSRYFDTATIIPPAIYREMDRKTHRDRVSRSGRSSTSRGMISAGWDHLYKAEKNPSSYRPTDELFTPDRTRIYGVMLKGKGARYGAEVNGIRSRWGTRQNEEFQRTAPYYALRSSKPLLEAIHDGKRRAFRSSKVKSATRSVSDFQMLYWMRELTEIVIFDYIFSQQDRVGNIDYRWVWYWVQEGKVHKKWQAGKFTRRHMNDQQPPAEIAQYSPVLIQRTCLNDNDAGGRVPYANFTKTTGMLQKLRHISAKTYTKLIHLNRDLQDQGPIYRYIQQNFILDAGQQRQIVKNTRLATDILKDTCDIGKLRFDLDNPKGFLINGNVQEQQINCGNL